MVWGVLERNNNILKAHSAQNHFMITLDMIADYLIEAQKGRMDAHIITGGQNGLGKSMFQLALAKTMLKRLELPSSFAKAYESKKLKFFYAYDKQPVLTAAIKEHTRSIFVIDELRTMFDYKRHQDKPQVELYNTVEVARSHLNVFIGGSRDYTKVDNNYRNAKAQLLIYILDKVVDDTKLDENGCYPTLFTYGAVFLGNPALEQEDKFGFSQLRGYSLEGTKYLCEKLPTWVGNIVIQDVSRYGVTKEDLRLYDEEKEKGVQAYTYGQDKKLSRAEKRTQNLEDELMLFVMEFPSKQFTLEKVNAHFNANYSKGQVKRALQSLREKEQIASIGRGKWSVC